LDYPFLDAAEWSFAVWRLPEHSDGRVLMTAISLALPELLPSSDRLRTSLANIVKRWGARFGGAWEGYVDFGPFTDPVDFVGMVGGEVEPMTLGPNWLMALRPDVTAVLDAAWQAAHGLTPKIMAIECVNGQRYELWQLSDSTAGPTGEDLARWVAALGSAMP
jgi:hypothetical protein